MARKQKSIKVLLCQFPLETHSRGIVTVAYMLRDAGMEVIFIGNAFPEQIIETAVQEDTDVIGVSTYCGGALTSAADLLQVAEERGIRDRTVFLLGGIFPPEDAPRLIEMGFSGVFPPSSTSEEIVSCIEAKLRLRPLTISPWGADAR